MDLTPTLRELPALADDINRHHRECLKAMNKGLCHANEAGKLLAEAKAHLPHGVWGSWLCDHFEGSVRTAQLYMRVASKWSEIEKVNTQEPAHLTLESANWLLAAHRPEPEPRDADPLDWFLDEGLTDEHLYELRQIRDVVGDGEWSCPSCHLPIADSTDAAIVLHDMAPEQHAVFYAPGDAVLGLLNRYLERGGDTVDNWQRIAFWYGCRAVKAGWRAGTLARAIDNFVERHFSAIVYLTSYPEKPEGLEQTALHWGARADLGHAGVDLGAVDDKRRQRATDTCRKRGLCAPSEIQHIARCLADGDDTLTPAQKELVEALSLH